MGRRWDPIPTISAAVVFAGGASGMSWALASVAAPAHCTASLGSIQNFGGYLGGALAPTVTGFIVQATGTFVPALLVGAVIALASALAYLVVIPNRPIRSAELGVAHPLHGRVARPCDVARAPVEGLGAAVSLSTGR
jgi:cyanate permease